MTRIWQKKRSVFITYLTFHSMTCRKVSHRDRSHSSRLLPVSVRGTNHHPMSNSLIHTCLTPYIVFLQTLPRGSGSRLKEEHVLRQARASTPAEYEMKQICGGNIQISPRFTNNRVLLPVRLK